MLKIQETMDITIPEGKSKSWMITDKEGNELFYIHWNSKDDEHLGIDNDELTFEDPYQGTTEIIATGITYKEAENIINMIKTILERK